MLLNVSYAYVWMVDINLILFACIAMVPTAVASIEPSVSYGSKSMMMMTTMLGKH